MNYYQYSYLKGRLLRLDFRIFTCDICQNQYDNDEFSHFNRCKEMGVCVDCEPNACKGKYFKKKEDLKCSK